MGLKNRFLFSCTPKIFVLLCVLRCVSPLDVSCPPKCSCSESHNKENEDRTKAKCGGAGDLSTISTIEELKLKEFGNLTDLVTLDLSSNNISVLPSKMFWMQDLQKLYLSRNQIERIEDGAFLNLSSLKRLDLSSNKIRFITKPMLEGLMNLEKLKLNQNYIRRIREGSFDNLFSLKQLDLSINPLVCDCELWWLSVWTSNMSVKLTPNTKCVEPPFLKDQPIKKFRSSIQCAWHDTPPVLELSPGHDQVVFEGDSLRMDCRSGFGNVEDTKVIWYWAGLLPELVFPHSVHIESQHLALNSETTIVESTLLIEKLKQNHTGEWICELFSTEGNHSSTVIVTVISNSTRYCRAVDTTDNKGHYSWPETVAGHVVELPCQSETSVGVVRYNCTLSATWQNLNSSLCPYLSETTRILQQYAKMNLTAAYNTIFESAKSLHSYTLKNKQHLNDSMDVVFIAQTISNYLNFLDVKNLGDLLLDLIGYVMELDSSLLSVAQMEDKSCSKLLNATETIIPLTYLHQPSYKWNMAVDRFSISRSTFSGLTCTWWRSRDRNPGSLISHCSKSAVPHYPDKGFPVSIVLGHLFIGFPRHNTIMRSLTRVKDFYLTFTQMVTFTRVEPVTRAKVLEASIKIPASLFQQLESQGKPAAVSQDLIVAMFENTNLFPLPFNSSRTISSPVVGAKLAGLELDDLTEPVIVMLGGLREGTTPVWWSETIGQWAVRPCRQANSLHDLHVLHCTSLGYFALVSPTHPTTNIRNEPWKSKYTSPGIFVGSFVGGTCLLVAAFTYAVCYPSIQMSARMKHALPNTWLAMAFLTLLFSLGIYQTENVKVCQSIGLMLHYLTLCSLFWMAVSINCMHRSGFKGEMVSEEPSQPVPNPAIGLYLVGWGVPGLLVGLSGAVNPAGYANRSFCSLGPGPGFTPVIVPVTAVAVFIFTRALMVRSAAVEKDSNAQLSEGTQATDLELLETVAALPERTSLHSVTTPSSHIEDLEHPPYLQLKAFMIVITFFSVVWASGTMSVLQPLHLSHEETVFGVFYAVFIITLGAFVVFFYCFSRSDVRSVWFSLKHIKRSRNVTDLQQMTPPVLNPQNSVSSSTGGRKSISPRPEPQGEVSLKTNFVDLHRRQYHNNVINEPNTFYNPHQSIVARKFFKKQRRKQNNLGTRRRGDGGNPVSPDNSELFLLGAKINNKNIHAVLPTPQMSNVNVLNVGRPLERLVIGAERGDSSAKYASVGSDCCSCLVSEAHSATDCTRDLTSEHSSRSSHLYAMVAPDLSPYPGKRHNSHFPIDYRSEMVRLNTQEPPYVDIKSSDEEKIETSV